MWLAEVKAKAKRKNQILFSKDSLLLADLCQLIAQANRRALILWALELAEETARELAGKYPEDHRPLDAIAASGAWASGEIKMPIAKQAILNCHAMPWQRNWPILPTLPGAMQWDRPAAWSTPSDTHWGIPCMS